MSTDAEKLAKIADWVEDMEGGEPVFLDRLRAVLAEPGPAQPDFVEQVRAERERQIALGWTPEHDRQHGVDHLLRLANHYLVAGRTVATGALILAARELLAEPGPAFPAHDIDRDALLDILDSRRRDHYPYDWSAVLADEIVALVRHVEGKKVGD